MYDGSYLINKIMYYDFLTNINKIMYYLLDEDNHLAIIK